MEKLPVELLGTISEYLQVADIFSLLHINRGFNRLWKNIDYWSIICKGRGNYIRLISNELKLALEELEESNSNEDCKSDRNARRFELEHTSPRRVQNLDGIKDLHCTQSDHKSTIWKVFIKKKLLSLNLTRMTSIFQDVDVYKCDKKIIAVFSPLIMAISDQFLEVYELANDIYASREGPSASSKVLVDIKTMLVARLSLNTLKESRDSSWNNCETSAGVMTTAIVKWAFLDKNTVLCITKDYGIYLHEINNFSERIVLKKQMLDNSLSVASRVVTFEISGHLLAVCLEDGSMDIWRLLHSGHPGCGSGKEKWRLLHNSTIHFEQRYSRSGLFSMFDELPSPLTWACISHNCGILLAVYKGVVNEIRIFSVHNLDLNSHPRLLHRIPLQSDVQACQIDPKGRFIICVDSNKEPYPKTRFYSLSSGKLLLTQNFRIICPIFTPCGHLMIGAYRTHSGIPAERSANSSKNFKASTKHIGAEFMGCYFISIWSIPSLKEIHSFNCGVSEQIINIRFSRTRCSTAIITTTINRNSSDCIDGPVIKTSSNIYFISHDIFAQIGQTNSSHFPFEELE